MTYGPLRPHNTHDPRASGPLRMNSPPAPWTAGYDTLMAYQIRLECADLLQGTT
jgi:hypothetical protein